MKAKHILLFCVGTLLMVGCKKRHVFLGNLTPYTDLSDTISVQADSVSIGLLHSPFFAVYDSLLISFSPMDNNYTYRVYHAETGESLGNYFPCGHGNGEFVTISPITQFFEEGGQLKSIVYAPNEQKLMKWNITESLKQRKTVSNDMVDYQEDEIDRVAHYSRFFYLGKNRVAVYRPSVHLSPDRPITYPVWQVRTYSTNELIEEISAYKPLENKESKVIAENFFSVSTCIKPDMTRMAEAMYWLPQINIIDINKGRVDGYLMREMDDYSIFYTDMAHAKTYYRGMQANDQHIFALWYGRELTRENYGLGANELHVFDWKGKMVKKVRLSVSVHYIFLDVANNLLYGWHEDSDKLYKYQIENMKLL